MLCQWLFFAFLMTLPLVAQPVAQLGEEQSAGLIARGRELLALHCGGCHGGDGTGGERAPDIVSPGLARRYSGEKFAAIVRDRIPGRGMPPSPLTPGALEALTAYYLSRTALAKDQPAPGDARAGKAFFDGAGTCARCHGLLGRPGDVAGPDLSDLGAQRTREQIERSISDPAGEITAGYRLASLMLADGEKLRGFIRNESNFSLQLQIPDGRLRFLRREEIAELSREKGSLMPRIEIGAAERRDLLAYLTRLGGGGETTGLGAGLEAGLLPGAIGFETIENPRASDWPTYNGRLSGNRHSGLDQIHTGNVAGLAPRWIFPIRNPRRLQVTPLVVHGVMYVTGVNAAYALDAKSGREIWRFQRQRTKGVIGDAGSGINRGVAVLGDRVFLVTDDARLLALHRLSGRLVWETKMADPVLHYGATVAPLVVNDLVVAGVSGGDEGARGFLAAYRAESGKQAWRFWTVPTPGEKGSETWIGNAWEHGCGTTWLTGSYDPEAKLLYWTTGNPCPDYNGDERKGDNLYTDAVIALDPASGKLRWYYQFTPHDLHDWDAVQTVVLVDAEFGGRPRKLLMQANRNGFFYVLDRLNGELLLAKPFVDQLSWASGIGSDGRPVLVPDQIPTPAGTKTCPAVEGATNWMSPAYNPITKLFYVMTLEKCGIYIKRPQRWTRGDSFYGGTTRVIPGERGGKYLRAIDPETGKRVWEVAQTGSARSWGGVLSTAGGLLFYGDDGGALAAVAADTGRPLWHFQTNVLWKASPMTYMVDGRQYVAVAAGGNIIAFGLR